MLCCQLIGWADLVLPMGRNLYKFRCNLRDLVKTQSRARGRAVLFNQGLFQLVSLEEGKVKETSNPFNWKGDEGD